MKSHSIKKDMQLANKHMKKFNIISHEGDTFQDHSELTTPATTVT